jgi:ubiquinone/menaquinone biosynthesis C-methylase UbiE
MRYLSPEQARRFYDRVGRLQDTQRAYERPALGALADAGGFEQAHAVLEFGCGTGRLAADLMARLPMDARYVGLDSSKTMVRLARQRLRRFGARATVTQSDGSMRLPFDDRSFDRVVATYVLDLLSPDDSRELLAEAHRVLQPEGRLCLASLTRGRSGAPRRLTKTWEWVAARRPVLTGGCRPVELRKLLLGSAWTIDFRRVITVRWVPSELVVAHPR